MCSDCRDNQCSSVEQAIDKLISGNYTPSFTSKPSVDKKKVSQLTELGFKESGILEALLFP